MSSHPVIAVVVDEDVCAGHARCLVIAPDIFDVDDDTGRAVVIRQPGNADELEHAQRAARGCPERAITVIEAP